MKKNTIYFCLAILFLNVQCSKNEVLSTPFPLIESVDISSITSAGVEFSAKLKNANKSEIIEYGFIWGEPNDELTYQAGEKLIVGKDLNEESFSIKLTHGMLDNEDYKVRAYLKTIDKVLLSYVYYFKSKGGTLTKIISVEPDNGVAGDTIKIIGENFSPIKNNNKIIFGRGYNTNTTIIKSTNSEITFIVPYESSINPGNFKDKLRLEVYGQEFITDFVINNPKINSVSPLTGTFRDEITIHGENFSYIDEYNKVYFNDVLAETTFSINKNTLKVKVPPAIKNKHNNVRVLIGDYGNTYNQNFVVTEPKVTSISQGPIYVGNTITITGENLNPVLKYNSVNFFGRFGNFGEVISGDKTHIVVKVPEGPYPTRKAVIVVGFGEVYYSGTVIRDIGDKWVLRAKRFYRIDRKKNSNNVVIANNTPIFASKSWINEKTLMVSLIPKESEITFTNSEISEDEILNSGVISTLTDGNSAYIYFHSDKNFRKFNKNANTWSNHKNFPGKERENVTQFTINGEIYLGFGKSSDTYFNDMYKYSPQNDSWTQVSSNPSNTKRDNTAVFVINDVAYMVGGATDSNSKDCWAYYSNTDTWVKIADYPYSINGAAAFTLDGEGYVTAGKIIGGNIINEVWKYNPINDNWTQSENVGLKPRYNHAAFSLNGRGYVFGGIIDESNTAQYDSEVYEFIK